MKIILADDHHLILDGLKSVLEKHFSNVFVECALNLNSLLHHLENKQFDILIQDVKFGNDNFKEFVDTLNAQFPELKIIVLSSVSDSVSIRQLRKKISGYILKSESLDEIIEAVKHVKIGGFYFSSEAKKRLEEFSGSDEIILTRREREVLSVILKEKSTREIAEELCISEKTVELHRSNLFIKLDVKNITGLVKKAIALNLLEE
jgi:DNA-binding NarL/FixJ family response regulator